MYAHLAPVTFEHAACCGSIMTTYATFFAWLVEQALVHWYQQFLTTRHVTKMIFCSTTSTYIYIYIYIYIYMYVCIYIYIYIYVSIN